MWRSSILARFISPDPIIQAPYVTNSFNRYAYVMNNPLKYTDPTGFRAIEGAGISEPGIKDGMGRYDPPRDNGNSSRDPSNRKDRDRSTPSTPVNLKPKPKEEEEPKVEPTVEPPSPKNHWGNKDFAGEMDPAVRNKALSDTINSLTGVEDFVDAAEIVLDANATVVDKVVAVGAAISKRTPIGKVAGKVVTKGAGRKLPFADKDRLTEINKTLDRIESNGPFPHKRDGITFKNREGKLPEGNYKEYTVDTQGSSNRGARRVVQDQNTGKTYYTDDHYENFTQIDPKRY